MSVTTQAPQKPGSTTGPLTLAVGALFVVAVVSAAVGLVIAGGAYQPALPGLPEVGGFVGWGGPVVRVATDLLAIGTVGWLLAATALDPSGRDGVVSRAGRRDLVRASITAAAWAAVALLQMLLELANVLGMTFAEVLNPHVITTYANEIPATRALFFMALLAAIVAVGAALTSSTGASLGWLVIAVAAAALPALAGHSAGMGDHGLAMSAGVAHVVAAVIWMGGLLALAIHATRDDVALRRAAERFSTIALCCIVLLAASGAANAYTRLDTPSQLLTTGYGQLVVVKTVLILGLGGLGWIMRSRILGSLDEISRRMAFARVAGLELTMLAIALGLGVALASSPPPRVMVELPSYGETLLGFPYPPPPTAANVSFGFHLDALFLVGCIVAAVLYVAGAMRLARRGDTWPWLRTASWLVGLAILVWTTNAGISEYAQVSVGLHMLQHMTMTMLSPVFLVLGAPATLALRALKPAASNERGPREWLVWFLHSWITRILTNPFFVFFIYVLGLYGLYLTGLFGWLMGSHVGHVAMQLHFVVSGYLFYWVLIGIDPRPKPLSYWGRLLLLLLALSVHGFFAVVLMMDTTPMAAEWYGIVQPSWVTDPLRDTLNGGQVAWGLAEIPTIIVLVVIAVQWSRSDDREAARADRQADRDDDAELRAYNDRLAALARRDQREQ